MSIAAVAWAMKQPVSPTTRKFVLNTMAQYADADGKCWPKQEAIAEQVGIGVRMVKKHVRALVAEGFLRVEHHGPKGNTYSLPINVHSSSLNGHQKGNSDSSITDTTVPLSENEKGNSSTSELDSKRGTPVSQKGNSSTSPVPLNNPPYPQGTVINRQEKAAVAASHTRPRARESPAWLERLSLDAWKNLTPTHIAELESQAMTLGIDLAAESLACDEWMKANRRSVKAPYSTLKNWLNKAKNGWNGDRRRDNRTGFGRIIPPKPGELSITRRHTG